MGERAATMTQAMLDELGELASHPSRGSNRVDDAVLVELVHGRGWKKQQAAEFFEVSGAAVTKGFKRIESVVNTAVATRGEASRLLSAQLEGSQRLSDLVAQCEELLGLCRLVTTGDQRAQEVFDARGKLQRLAGPKGNVGTLAVALLAEARKQLEFLFNMQREAYSLRRVEDFQSAVLEEIKAADPATQKRIMDRLVQLQAFRSSFEISGGGQI